MTSQRLVFAVSPGSQNYHPANEAVSRSQNRCRIKCCLLLTGPLRGDCLARRIARFDKQSITGIKHLVDAASLPPNEAIAAEWEGFIGSVKRPAAQARIKQLMELGLQENADVEKRLAHYTGTLGEESK